MKIDLNLPPITYKQINYINILATDTELSTIKRRDAYISSKLGRDIKNIGTLNIQEGAYIISLLQERKKNLNKC